MSYTKGGWSRNIPPATKYAVVFAGRNTHVAVVCSQGLPPDEVEANCSLIAAAPDVLEALEEIVEWLDRAGESRSAGGKEYSYVTAARTAIARARKVSA